MRLSLRTITAFALLALAACTVRSANAVVPPGRANVSETLDVKLAASSVPSVIRDVQGDSTIDDANVSVRISPSIAQRRSVALASEAYVLALADARAKAAAIAHNLGLRLGQASSVSEIVPDGRGGFYGSMPQPRGMNGVERSMLQAPPNGVVTLAVTFDGGGAPISVFGIHAGAPPPTALSDADGVWVTISARGESFAAAGRKMRLVESALRFIVRRYGAAVVVTDADAATY